MFEENKKLKDLQKDSIKDTASMPAPHLPPWRDGSGSYTKTHKLITALYMVTDIIDKDEPLRNKLRTLGTEIISDTSSSLLNTCNKITEIMSFLDIASAVNIISEMNCNILRKEFLKLDQSIKEATGKIGIPSGQVDLVEFFRDSPLEEYSDLRSEGGGRNLSTPAFGHPSRGELINKGHTRIGVQKGSTLLKAIKDMSNRNDPAPYEAEGFRSGFDILKKQRREDIINIIKIVGGNATIKDIRDKAQGTVVACSEKTLQRELISMVKDGVLNKTGEKRWSRYFIK